MSSLMSTHAADGCLVICRRATVKRYVVHNSVLFAVSRDGDISFVLAGGMTPFVHFSKSGRQNTLLGCVGFRNECSVLKMDSSFSLCFVSVRCRTLVSSTDVAFRQSYGSDTWPVCPLSLAVHLCVPRDLLRDYNRVSIAVATSYCRVEP